MKREVRKLKRYSESFKKSRVREYDSGEFTALELSRLYGFTQSCLYKWIGKYSKLARNKILIVEEKQSASIKLAEYEKRIKDLEASLGRKQIKLDYLEKLIDIAEEDLGVNIKKNSDTQQSAISLKIEDK